MDGVLIKSSWLPSGLMCHQCQMYFFVTLWEPLKALSRILQKSVSFQTGFQEHLYKEKTHKYPKNFQEVLFSKPLLISRIPSGNKKNSQLSQ